MSRLLFLRVFAVGGAVAHLACSPSSSTASQARATTAPVVSTPSPAVPPAGPRAEGEAFEIGLQLPARARAGEATTARVVVKAHSPYHVNRDYPMSFRSAPTATTTFGGERVALGEGAELTPCADHVGEVCTVSAPLRFTARDAGKARVAGTVSFSVCNPERCFIEKVPLSATIVAH